MCTRSASAHACAQAPLYPRHPPNPDPIPSSPNEQEITILAAVCDLPHIVTLYEVWEDGNYLYLVMVGVPWLDGLRSAALCAVVFAYSVTWWAHFQSGQLPLPRHGGCTVARRPLLRCACAVVFAYSVPWWAHLQNGQATTSTPA